MAQAQLYPGSKFLPLGAQTQTKMKAHDIVCLHTMVGYLVSTDQYFRIGNGVGYRGTESHYGIGGIWGPDLGGLNGAVYQWQDRAYTADANLQGNPRVISIETADNAARPIAPWTDKQMEAIAQLLAWECSPVAHQLCPEGWECHKSGIPLQLIPDTKSFRRGIGYHRQGCDPYRGGTGELWSGAYGKDCPTQARINQIPRIILMARNTSGIAAPPITAPENAKTYLPLLVDGDFGHRTKTELQRAMKRLGYYTGVVEDDYGKPADFGKLSFMAYQRFLKDKSFYTGIIDGDFGKMSTTAEQKWLFAKGLYKGAIDGKRGPMTIKALQTALNTGAFV